MIDAALAAAVHRAADHPGHIRQVEIVHDLLDGNYDAVTTVSAAFAGAVLGLGVAEATDGEIVAFDGEVWRVPADGTPRSAPGDLGLPFAVAAAGGAHVDEALPPGADFSGIAAHIDEVLRMLDAAQPHVAAIRVDGAFSDVVMRSEPRQTPPYRPLGEVLAHEVRWTFPTWQGTLVGFRFPDVDDGIVIPGLHLHGVSADRASGGHCHTATVVDARLRIWVDDVDISIPHPHLAAALTEHG